MIALSLFLACTGPDDSRDPEACLDAPDSDADGLDDCAEAELGTDPALADTDADGTADGDEVACVSDPLDGAEHCYACGWAHGDPGDLTATGAEYFDTIENVTTIDQCGETVPLWDFAGTYRIVFMTATWCAPCLSEARKIEARGEAFTAATGIPFSYLVGVFEDDLGNPPTAEISASFADTIGATHTLPVLADPEKRFLEVTPFDGTKLPGKCILSPAMAILSCSVGHSEDDAGLFDLIEAHAQAVAED